MGEVAVFISSTFEDLKEHRAELLKQLRRIKWVRIVAMEDNVAENECPREACLSDVAACDVYVGVFAWRYGFVPKSNNPERRSITELEYREALATRKQCLIFLLGSHYEWPQHFRDSYTGHGNRGKRIGSLRNELQLAHTKCDFTSPEDLALEVTAAISNWRAGTRSSRQWQRWLPSALVVILALLMCGLAWLVHGLSSMQAKLDRWTISAAPQVGLSAEALFPQLNHEKLKQSYPYGYLVFASGDSVVSSFNPYPKDILLDATKAHSQLIGQDVIELVLPDVVLRNIPKGIHTLHIADCIVRLNRQFAASTPVCAEIDQISPQVQVIAVGSSGVVWVYGIGYRKPPEPASVSPH